MTGPELNPHWPSQQPPGAAHHREAPPGPIIAEGHRFPVAFVVGGPVALVVGGPAQPSVCWMSTTRRVGSVRVKTRNGAGPSSTPTNACVIPSNVPERTTSSTFSAPAAS